MLNTSTNMPVAKCPVQGCDYATEDFESTVLVTLLKLHQVSHAQPTAPQTTPKVKAETVKRPSTTASGTVAEWAYFTTRWTEYVEATGIEGKDRVIQLLECCDDELRRDLTRSSGGSLTSKDEKTVLESIRKLAVRTENTMVARVALHNMHQDRDEPVRSFCAWFMGQANICNYSVERPDCKKDVSYTNHIVRDCVTRGLSDDDIRLDVLVNESQHKTLDSLVSYIESKKASKRSISRLISSQGAEAARSHYQKQCSSSVREKMVKCTYCSETGHGNGFNKPLWKERCPAYGQTCRHAQGSITSRQFADQKADQTPGKQHHPEHPVPYILAYKPSF